MKRMLMEMPCVYGLTDYLPAYLYDFVEFAATGCHVWSKPDKSATFFCTLNKVCWKLFI